jgi:hypothetical protein
MESDTFIQQTAVSQRFIFAVLIKSVVAAARYRRASIAVSFNGNPS